MRDSATKWSSEKTKNALIYFLRIRNISIWSHLWCTFLQRCCLQELFSRFSILLKDTNDLFPLPGSTLPCHLPEVRNHMDALFKRGFLLLCGSLTTRMAIPWSFKDVRSFLSLVVDESIQGQLAGSTRSEWVCQQLLEEKTQHGHQLWGDFLFPGLSIDSTDY